MKCSIDQGKKYKVKKLNFLHSSSKRLIDITDHSVLFYGICSKCRAAANNK